MKIILAPDSFKETFTSDAVIHMLAEGCNKHFPDAELVGLPIADGGEGTAETFITVLGFKRVESVVSGPLDVPVTAYLALKGDTAVIEMAQASGLCLVASADRDPLRASTKGTGELILKALDAGARRLLIGIGGSATNDGGTGMAQALGIRFWDSAGKEIKCNGENLSQIESIDISQLDPRIRECEISAICDVKNPLTGEAGATWIYGPQKGADPKTQEILEQGMCTYKSALTRLTGRDADAIPGSGAAGGMGAAIALLLGGTLKPGIEAVLEAVGFDNLAADADMVITGEGRMDEQSAFGKVPFGIARRCKNLKAKVFVLAGSIEGDIEALYKAGIDGVYPIVNTPCSLEEALTDAEEKMKRAIDNMLHIIRAASEIDK